ncbi:ATP-binding cassette domain-containing protein [Allobaculum sp. Allo2]|uniref:ATP-binding cassette domain-containing protein n=1 Tax=Allobaculum sp. Allo2 TaxID=2853432 RepID=UPI003461E2F2
MKEKERILKIRDLDIAFTTDNGTVNAVRGVNLDLHRGETIAIVGESGSGKSVTTKAVMGILAGNGKIQNGSIEYTYYEFPPERIAEIQTKYNGRIPDGYPRPEERKRSISFSLPRNSFSRRSAAAALRWCSRIR